MIPITFAAIRLSSMKIYLQETSNMNHAQCCEINIFTRYKFMQIFKRSCLEKITLSSVVLIVGFIVTMHVWIILYFKKIAGVEASLADLI